MSKHQHTHSWALLTYLARRMCTHCGLIWLRNEASDTAARKPCKWWDA